MASVGRNTFVEGPWVLKKVEDFAICDSFDCGDDDLNEYFRIDSKHYRENLLTQTYCLLLRPVPDFAIALLDFCNDAVQLKNISAVLETDDRARTRSFPAVKLTRLGVAKQFQGQNIGSHTLNMIKRFFTVDNRTGCRLVTVDAWNRPEILRFYEKNNFLPLYTRDKDGPTRALFFDLKRLETT